MENWVQSTVAGANLLLVALTALPFVPSNASWIRVWDFPRQQITALLLAALLAAFWQFDLQSVGSQAIIALSMIALGCQALRIGHTRDCTPCRLNLHENVHEIYASAY